ncbi:MAG: hypothetical protein KGH55_02565 [Nanoarchaeota archaeon]|nr:hypothetical protein [Nanoarchaeota archaeon]
MKKIKSGKQIKKVKKKSVELPEKREKKFEIIEKEKPLANLNEESLEEELDFNGAEFSQDLRRVLSTSEFQSMSVDNSEIQPLERTAIFLPRPRFQESEMEIEDRNYASANYNEKYGENNYAAKTPGYVAKKSSSDSGNEKSSGKGNK